MCLARLSLLLLVLGTGPSVAWGQGRPDAAPGGVPDTLVERVSTAFQTGDAQLLLSPAADRVEVSLFGARTLYSSAQAFYVLREFFEKHPPVRFRLADTTGTGTSCFLRGELTHAQDERLLRVYVHLIQHSTQAWRLHEVRIDSEAE